MDFKELYQRDLEKKMQMKAQADQGKFVKASDIQIGDSMLVRQDASSKATPPFESEPLEVQHRKGTQVVARRKDGSTITRATAPHFRKVPYRSPAGACGSPPAAESRHGDDSAAVESYREPTPRKDHSEEKAPSPRECAQS